MIIIFFPLLRFGPELKTNLNIKTTSTETLLKSALVRQFCNTL